LKTGKPKKTIVKKCQLIEKKKSKFNPQAHVHARLKRIDVEKAAAWLQRERERE